MLEEQAGLNHSGWKAESIRGALWFKSAWNLSIHNMDKKIFLTSWGVGERVSKGMSTAAHVREASGAEQANEWAVRIYKQTDELVASYLYLGS